MIPFLLGLASTFLDAICSSSMKKSLDIGNLSLIMFKLFAQIFSFLIILGLILYFGFDTNLLNHTGDSIFAFLIAVIASANNLFQVKIMKQVKLSEILPYDNLDKLLIVIIGFFLYYGTDKQTSITSFLITLFAIFIIIFFSVDIKKLHFKKEILEFFLFKTIKAFTVLSTGYILLKYSTITFTIYSRFGELFFLSVIAIILKDNIKSLIQQDKKFYIYRIVATISGRSAFIIGLYIIQTSGVVIATLLGFLGIVFNILTMKYILKDSPSKKQIILAYIIILLIGVGYYFK